MIKNQLQAACATASLLALSANNPAMCQLTLDSTANGGPNLSLQGPTGFGAALLGATGSTSIGSGSSAGLFATNSTAIGINSVTSINAANSTAIGSGSTTGIGASNSSASWCESRHRGCRSHAHLN